MGNPELTQLIKNSLQVERNDNTTIDPDSISILRAAIDDIRIDSADNLNTILTASILALSGVYNFNETSYLSFNEYGSSKLNERGIEIRTQILSAVGGSQCFSAVISDVAKTGTDEYNNKLVQEMLGNSSSE